MSVEKYRIVKESANYTIIPNHVLQGLQDYEALGLYAYLCSLPDGWEFYKSQLESHGNIGRDKLKRLLKTLSDHNLVITGQQRGENGRYGDFSLHVKNGSDFNKSPLTEKPLTENRLLVNNDYKYNKDKTNNKSIKTISCSSGDERSKFDQFWSVYPRKENKKAAWKAWKAAKLDDHADMIGQDVIKRTLHHDRWQDKAYIPLPSTYLNGEQWTNDIVKLTPPAAKPPVSAVRPPVLVTNGYGSMRDFTQERIDREARKVANEAQRSDTNDQSRCYGMRPIKDHLLS